MTSSKSEGIFLLWRQNRFRVMCLFSWYQLISCHKSGSKSTIKFSVFDRICTLVYLTHMYELHRWQISCPDSWPKAAAPPESDRARTTFTGLTGGGTFLPLQLHASQHTPTYGAKLSFYWAFNNYVQPIFIPFLYNLPIRIAIPAIYPPLWLHITTQDANRALLLWHDANTNVVMHSVMHSTQQP